MPSGLDSGGGWVDSPTDLPGFGDMQWEGAGEGWGRSMVGSGGGWPDAGMLVSLSQTGFNRIATGNDLGEPIPGPAGRKVDSWQALFNYQHNPTFWIMVFALAAVGFIHARVQLGASAGRARFGGGVHI